MHSQYCTLHTTRHCNSPWKEHGTWFLMLWSVLFTFIPFIIFVIITNSSILFSFEHSIKFEFGLAAYANGGFVDLIFNAAIDLTIFGKRLYLAASFNLRDPVGSLRLGADRATVWYKDRMNRNNPTSTAENYYDNANPNTDFEMSGLCYTCSK